MVVSSVKSSVFAAGHCLDVFISLLGNLLDAFSSFSFSTSTSTSSPPPVSLPTCSSTSSNSSVIHLLRNNWWTGECRVGKFPTMRERMEGEEEEDGESSSVSNAGRIRDSTRISEESPEIRLKWAWESKSRRDEDHRS